MSETTVRDLMTTRVATIGPETRLEAISRAFERHPFHHLPVVQSDGTVLGIVSDRDLIRAATGGKFDGQKPASAVMTQMVASIPAEATPQQAAQRLVKLGVNSLLILTDDGKLRGILTTRDLVRHFAGPS